MTRTNIWLTHDTGYHIVRATGRAVVGVEEHTRNRPAFRVEESGVEKRARPTVTRKSSRAPSASNSRSEL